MKNAAPHDNAQKREYAEPSERANPVPWLLGLIAASLLVWGVSYFLLDPLLVPASHQTGSAVSVDSAAAIPAADGGAIYRERCLACHQASGGGAPPGFPPLAGSPWVTGSPVTLVQILLRGVQGKLSVGKQVFDGEMPTFSDLSDAQIAAVATHIRTSFGNKPAHPDPVSADLVKAERAKLPAEIKPFAGDSDLPAPE
ncbi:cytochrome C [Burkholderia sp. Nafp2/4-1b]|uniref:c-type cytochrome n=1 Tax=Burkholderia sp. Nafp2/4-1b TaxID=2116686 RepID=UPI000EF8AB02|nr:cytochrome c [Burkholderia sp. Nafp2/4-1b]RKT98817.1 cytochrome C [Burkholderia sp. Nafp2/4-1b]